MIALNGKPVEIGSFPDGSILIKQGYELSCRTLKFEWKYENDREFLALIYLVKHLRNLSKQANIGYRFVLYMPYIPNARMDRVKNMEDVFTLKYFAELLNSLEFDEVIVLDPHSSVSEALVNNLRTRPTAIKINILKVMLNLPEKNANGLLLFYPDEGSMKRYSGMVNLPYAFGIKKRNWETGVIEGLDVAGAVDLIDDRDILIVDDICSRGGTFLHAAKKLKELGARNIYLYVSHCENTILEGELLTSGLIKKVYTTDSIFTKSHELIEVLK